MSNIRLRREWKGIQITRSPSLGGDKGEGGRRKTMKCPVCGSINFFVKDPDDEYETYDFELKGDRVVFNPGAADISPEVKPDTDVFCERCSWHDKFQQLKNS